MRGVFAFGLSCGLGLLAGAARAAPPPIEAFFRTPAIAEATVSPDGKRAALAIAGPQGQTALAVVELANPKKITGVAGIDGSGVAGIRWVNDRRVIFGELDRGIGGPQNTEYRRLAINIDGTGFKRLIGEGKSSAVRDSALSTRNRLAATLRDGSADVLLHRCDPVEVREAGAFGSWRCKIELDRLNTLSGGAQPIVPDTPDNAAGWIADHLGQPRVMITQERDRLVYHWREGDGRWRPLAKVDALDGGGLAWQPTQVGPDGKLYVVASSGDAAGTSMLTTLNLQTGQPDPKPLVSIEGFDFRGTLVWDLDSRRLLGVHYLADARGTAWLDPSMKALQEDVDRQLPNTINVLQCGDCLKSRHMLVASYADVQPAVFFAYDRETRKLELIGASRPWIDARQMAPRELVRIPARDGLSVPVHLTRPRDAKGPLPTVVLIHGGPYVDGAAWGWDADAQFLASRGYLVIEPDYRGTMRYGFKHFRAGWKQWGLKMQDDITDATKWAVDQGLADPKRLVIAGASYGGYATMMGLVREPELYRAGINWVGVTDIVHWYNHPYSDLGDFGMRFFLPRMVGDLKTDRAQLEATSPVMQAARIKRPVLMAYGALDYRVPITHGRDMHDALKKHGVPVEWVEYAEEGHGWLKLENNVDFWRRVERFLAEHTR